uniref:NADH dehydrogenase subunit 6 n=1 Tax=Hydatophylax nigrovittatus TaxID=1310303 RepID=A0A4Y1JWL1_9NEOP|nr:NADH dehydrogenase subunit 6 [Hydatophylax nigrovittatus]APQ47887.1 NADH dehydrogenase subunit 6 [Hydatophylax nigrovittatus]
MFKFNIMLMMFLFNSFWLLNLNHPLIITIFIIIQTCILILITGIMSYSFSMPYIMFLSYFFIGGLLILFIYISSLTPNKIFYLNYKKIISIFSFIILFIMFIKIQPTLSNLEMTPLTYSMKFLNTENSLHLINFYNKNEMWMTLILMNYLLLALVISTKIILLNEGPMRIIS